MQFSHCLTDADALPQFIVSKIVTDPTTGKKTKVPCNPQGYPSNHMDPNNWMILSKAIARVKELGPEYRVGFSITKESKLFFIDMDKCLIDGEWSPLAKEWCGIFSSVGVFIEVSQSGTGIHFMGRYTGELIHKNKNTQLGIELYTEGRFVMFGDNHPTGDWGKDATAEVNAIISQCFNPSIVEQHESEQLSLSDEEILNKLKSRKTAKEVFRKNTSQPTVTFIDLYECNEDVLQKIYRPIGEGEPFDRSSADLALANMFAAFTKDKEQITRLMWTSQLARDKWSTHKTYLSTTISNALLEAKRQAMQFSHGQSNNSTSISQTEDDDMPAEFAGCFYVVAEREVYSTRYGMLNQDAFNICFGGPYLKEQPYKTFKGHAKASGRIIGRLGFRPDLPNGSITEREGITSINIYKPLTIRMKQGDMTPFFKFFNAAYPNERDRQIILSYAAVLAQKPGVKSQWCLILQGVQGCGKSLLADFIAYACGETYTHRAKGDEFENRFNSQWFGKTLILIEDPRLQSAKLEEMLKPLVTSNLLAFEGKGKNVQMNDFPANFILTLNDFELIQKKKESRRLAVFMSALQTPEDLITAGMTPTEFRKIIDWKTNGGNEIVAHYLHNYKVDPQFDFSGGCVTAPNTSTTELAIESSRPNIELIILEEVAQGRVGFKDGWISSTALNDFICQQRLRYLMPDNRRGQILKNLGYEYHPGLREGQAYRNVLPDNKRSRLYIKKGHPAILLTDRDLILKAYEDAQK